MNQHRFFISPDQIHGKRVTFSGGQARQIAGVLRMREAQQIVVLDDRGWHYDVRLDKVTSDHVTGEIMARKQAGGEPQTHLTLYQAMLKKDNFEWVLQKGTEIGVSRFVPLITQRCVVRQATLKPAKLRRWQRILTEAAEQSGRGLLPALSTPVALDQALHHVTRFDNVLIPWERAKEFDIAEALTGKVGERIALFIGPEGGFADDEIEEAVAAGVQPVTLGSRILRSETAALVAATLALATLGDLK